MQHKKWYQYLFALLAIAVAFTQCKKNQNFPAVTEREAFTEKAKQYLLAIMPAGDFAQLDWGKIIVYKKEGKFTHLKIPLAGSRTVISKAVYLKYEKEAFSGNYFSIDQPSVYSETITTHSLDNVHTCIIRLTPDKHIKSYRKYEHGILIYDSQNGTGPNTAVRFVRAYINNAGQLLIWTSMLAAGLPGNGDPLTQQQLDNMGTLAYLSPDPSFSDPAGGGNSTVLTIDYDYLESTLALTTAQYDWLYDNPMEAAQLYAYLQSSTQPEKVDIAKEHVTHILTSNEYADFVKNHTNAGNPFVVWWVDGPWLDNTDNFNLDITREPPQQKYKLTAEEKALAALFPVQAFEIKLNIEVAFVISTARMGAGTNSGTNDKKDAFRHAFF
jgi:hypothetical protein